MLIEFKCRNFLSYKDETSLFMVPVESYKEHQKTHLIDTNRDEFRLLKSSAVYGSNGGGKTNLIKAIAVLNQLVHNSFADSLKKEEDKKRFDYFYRLCTGYENKSTMFEVSFLIDSVIYRYGIEIKGESIISEWLYKNVKKETLLFERIGDDFSINETGFPEGKERFKEVNKNVLFLSHLAQYNSPESSIVFSWFKKLNAISGLGVVAFKRVTYNLLKENSNFKKWISLALRFLEINGISSSKERGGILIHHARYDENNSAVDIVNFKIEEESEGTKQLVYLLGAIYDTLIFGKILCIDEFNSKLHPNLSTKLVEFFHKLNKNGAQFIFTAHDPTLLDKELFRRDQIWFVDRNQYGASELYPMSKFKSADVRSTSDFRKKYLNSDFGAAETIDFSQELTDLIK